jgi:hypothetical protein
MKIAKLANPKWLANRWNDQSFDRQAIFIDRSLGCAAEKPDDLTENVGSDVDVGRKFDISTVLLWSYVVSPFVIIVPLRGDLRASILAAGKRLWYDNDIPYTHATEPARAKPY